MTDYSRWLLGTGACLTLWWFGFTPQWLILKIWRTIAAVLGIFLGPVIALLRGSPDEEELLTLKASMRNVTRDYDQVGSLGPGSPGCNVLLPQVRRAPPRHHRRVSRPSCAGLGDLWSGRHR